MPRILSMPLTYRECIKLPSHNRPNGPAWCLSFIYLGGSIEQYTEAEDYRAASARSSNMDKSKLRGDMFDLVTISLVLIIFLCNKLLTTHM